MICCRSYQLYYWICWHLLINLRHVWSKPWLYMSHWNETQNFIIYQHLKNNFFCGSYVINKFLQCCISWFTHQKAVLFSCFFIHDCYNYTYNNNDTALASNTIWDASLYTNGDWPNIFKYLRKFIFHNQIKELFYKICMRVHMIGHRMEILDTPNYVYIMIKLKTSYMPSHNTTTFGNGSEILYMHCILHFIFNI